MNTLQYMCLVIIISVYGIGINSNIRDLEHKLLSASKAGVDEICEVLQPEPVVAHDGRLCYVVRQNGRIALVLMNQFASDYNGEKFVRVVQPLVSDKYGSELYKPITTLEK
jgi:hypothetical protein